eukprot:466221_1
MKQVCLFIFATYFFYFAITFRRSPVVFLLHQRALFGINYRCFSIDLQFVVIPFIILNNIIHICGVFLIFLFMFPHRVSSSRPVCVRCCVIPSYDACGGSCESFIFGGNAIRKHEEENEENTADMNDIIENDKRDNYELQINRKAAIIDAKQGALMEKKDNRRSTECDGKIEEICGEYE